MLKTKKEFSSFSVKSLKDVADFYKNVLGLKVTDTGMGLSVELSSGGRIHIYEKENHQPAAFTVLNFEVESIDEAVDTLAKNGVSFEHYEGFDQDEKEIARGRSGYGPSIAWFKDPAGNILSVLEAVK